MEKVFYKTGLNISHDKDMFEYLKNHFKYSTANSWNKLTSIANNVKLYNLNLEGDIGQASKALDLYGYDVITAVIDEWENQHPGYEVGFNGRSSGYLVLYNKLNLQNVLPYYIEECDYEGYKRYCKETYGSLHEARSHLVELVNLVRDFDKLCDDLRDYVNKLSKINYTEMALNMAIEDFNDMFEEEMNLLNIEAPKLIDIYQIKLDPMFKNYRSLELCLYDTLERSNLSFKVKHEQDMIEVYDEK